MALLPPSPTLPPQGGAGSFASVQKAYPDTKEHSAFAPAPLVGEGWEGGSSEAVLLLLSFVDFTLPEYPNKSAYPYHWFPVGQLHNVPA